MYIFKRNDIYYFRTSINNKDIKLSLQTSSKRQATIRANQLIGSFYIVKNMKFSSYDDYIAFIQDQTLSYADRAKKEYSEHEDRRFERMKSFSKETITQTISHFSDLVFDIRKKEELKREPLIIIKEDNELTNIYSKLETDKEKTHF